MFNISIQPCSALVQTNALTYRDAIKKIINIDSATQGWITFGLLSRVVLFPETVVFMVVLVAKCELYLLP